MKYRFAAIALGAGLAAGLGVASASAAPPETTTTVTKNLVESFVDVVPTCDESGADTRSPRRRTWWSTRQCSTDGRVHATFTQTGRFVATNPTLPDFTGKFTTWGNFNVNGKTENTTFTFTVHGTGDDGSTFKHHETAHSNTRPDGSVKEFFRCHDS